MSRDPHHYDPQIGATLRDARRRLGLEVKEVEERTKIRARYLRALENEDWEALPGPAYIRGFLRTYGALLGLDGEMLADEFRRRFEEPAAAGSPVSESVLEERRRLHSRSSPSRTSWLIGIAAVLVLGALIFGLLSGGEEDSGDGRGEGQRGGNARNDGNRNRGNGGAGGGGGGGSARREPIDVRLTALSGVEICLVEGSDTALIDGQVLSAGTEEEYGGARRYRLDLLSGGRVRVEAGGQRERIETDEPLSLELDSRGIREVEAQGGDCP
jgi:cytoskeleton protein RodZ